MIEIDARGALEAVTRLTALASLVVSIEYLSRPAPLRDDGLMSWLVGRLRAPWLASGLIGALLHAVLRYPVFLGVLSLRAAVCLALTFGPSWVVFDSVALWLAAILCGLTWLRSDYGHDGADQMSWICHFALAIGSLWPAGFVQSSVLWFIAAMLAHAYVTAGVAKALSPGWRSGAYLPDVIGTKTYGLAALGDVLRARPVVARAASLSVIVWECTFPLIFVTPLPYAWAFLAVGVVFHLTNALVMGLNTFLLAFLATYPAVVQCRLRLPDTLL